MVSPFDEDKHARDKGKFSRIPGGKGQGDPTGSEQPVLPGQPTPGSPMDQARQSILSQVGPTQEIRSAGTLRSLGFNASMGYRGATKAIDALHASGDLQAIQHHGKVLQNSIKSLKKDGAKPEEIDKLRHGLTNLHSALMQSDKVAAHEALTQLQHGFYSAHAAFQKENGTSQFPKVGTAEEEAGLNTEVDEMKKAAMLRPLGGKHSGDPKQIPSGSGVEHMPPYESVEDRKKREAGKE